VTIPIVQVVVWTSSFRVWPLHRCVAARGHNRHVALTLHSALGCIPKYILLEQVGSIFEIVNRNPIFGVLPPENPLWLPILSLFAVTGLPSAGV